MNSVEAVDSLFSVIKSAWEGISQGPVKWPDSEQDIGSATEFLEVEIQHLDGRQASLASDTGLRKYSESGLLNLAINTQLASANLRCYTVADAILLALRQAKISGMIIRNCRKREAGPDGAFTKVYVIAGFEYESHA